METLKKITSHVLSALILILFVVSLIPCIIGRAIVMIPYGFTYFLDGYSVPKWAEALSDKLTMLYDEKINLMSSL